LDGVQETDRRRDLLLDEHAAGLSTTTRRRIRSGVRPFLAAAAAERRTPGRTETGAAAAGGAVARGGRLRRRAEAEGVAAPRAAMGGIVNLPTARGVSE